MDWIEHLQIHEHIEEKLWRKHHVSIFEVEEVLINENTPPYAERGQGGLWFVYGQTDAGRYLLVVLAQHGRGVARVVTARGMTDAERRRYQRHAR